MDYQRNQFNSWQLNYQGKKPYNQNNRFFERDNYHNLSGFSSNSYNYSNNYVKERVDQVNKKNNINFDNTDEELKKINDDIFYYKIRKEKLHEDMQKIKCELREINCILSKMKIKSRKLEKNFDLEKRINSIENSEENFNNEVFDNFVSNSFQEKKNEIKFVNYDYIFETIEEVHKPEKVQFDEKNHYEFTFISKKMISFEEKNKGYKFIFRASLFDETSELQKDNLTFVKNFEILYQNETKLNKSVSSEFIFPFDLIDYCTLNEKFTIKINFDPEIISKKEFKAWCFGVFLVKKFKFQELLPILQKNEIIKKKNQEITKKQIKNAFVEETELETNSIKISLIDPITKERIIYPCVGKFCKHFNVFDGLSFLKSKCSKLSWYCPICGQPINYQDLCFDELITGILKKISLDCNNIEMDVFSNFIPELKLKKNDVEFVTLE